MRVGASGYNSRYIAYEIRCLQGRRSHERLRGRERKGQASERVEAGGERVCVWWGGGGTWGAGGMEGKIRRSASGGNCFAATSPSVVNTAS